MPIPDDIHRRIVADFGAGAAPDIVTAIEAERSAAPKLFTDRIVRCAVHVAAGDAERLRTALALARTDDRDLIVWAEYDNEFKDRKRDLTQPFGD